MFQLFRRILTDVSKIRYPLANNIYNHVASASVNLQSERFFGSLIKNERWNNNSTGFLQPVVPVVVPECGMRIKGKLKLRCKDCYMVWRFGKLFVFCKTFPRHKQMQMHKKPHNTWTLAHATQGKRRPW